MSRIALLVLLSLVPAALSAGNFGDGTTANTASASGTTYLSSNTAVSDGTVVTLTTNLGSWAFSGGTITFKHMRSAGGGSYTFVAQSSALSAQQGSNAYTVNFTNVLKGDYFGYYLSSTRPKGKTATGGSGTSYYYSGNHTSGTQSYTSDSNPISLAGYIEITADITANTTWDSGGSPYIINPSGTSGGTIKVRNGATLTIDSTNGALEVRYIEDCDFQIGNGSGDAGDLIIKAAGGTITFKIKTGGNVIVNTHGSITFSSTAYRTVFTQFSGTTGENNPGALQFDAGQTKQSALKKCDFNYMGYDSKDGALYIKSSATYVPTLEDITFDSCNTSAIRMDGNGINVLKAGNVKLPLSVTNTTYAFYLSAVSSTAAQIQFPDLTTPDSPTNYLSGTCTVGDSSNPSHWRFSDGYVFKCANSSQVSVTRGSVWGSSEAGVEFRSVNGSPGLTDWAGLQDNGTSYTNAFGDTGPFAYLTVRDASTGVYLAKGTSGSLYYGATVRLPKLNAYHCYNGLWLGTPDAFLSVEDSITGGSTSTDWCNSGIVVAGPGEVRLERCRFEGVESGGRQFWAIGGSKSTLADSAIRGPGTYAVYVYAPGAATDVTITRTIIESSATYGVYAYTFPWLGTEGAVKLRMSHSYVQANTGTSYGIYFYGSSTSPIDAEIDDCSIAGTETGVCGAIVKAGVSAHGITSNVKISRCIFYGGYYGVVINDQTYNTAE
ncbi:MAG: right-handed parallel beta-helix repeat-containing protein, partial [Planctomycetes bacterium]|nr:right-handed parallel beta-helix repeat-containing protein [Planctomycetota bacterium]